MQAINQYLAEQLKQVRKEKGWSLDKASQQTGVSKAMLGQIERGESSPTVATLWKIASGCDESLSRFLEPRIDPDDVHHVRSANALRQQPASDKLLVSPLFPFEQRFGFELFELTMLPGYENYSEPHSAGVTEHVVVISGSMALFIDGEWLQLEAGDALRFAADQPHGYRNTSQHETVFHDLIHYHHSCSP